MTQSEFARRIGISQGSLSDIESGKTQPSIETLRSIAKKNRGLTLDWLLLGKEVKAVPPEKELSYSASEKKLHDKVQTILRSGDKEARSALASLVKVLTKIARMDPKKRDPR